jgi:hypothetical protein
LPDVKIETKMEGMRGCEEEVRIPPEWHMGKQIITLDSSISSCSGCRNLSAS